MDCSSGVPIYILAISAEGNKNFCSTFSLSLSPRSLADSMHTWCIFQGWSVLPTRELSIYVHTPQFFDIIANFIEELVSKRKG